MEATQDESETGRHEPPTISSQSRVKRWTAALVLGPIGAMFVGGIVFGVPAVVYLSVTGPTDVTNVDQAAPLTEFLFVLGGGLAGLAAGWFASAAFTIRAETAFLGETGRWVVTGLGVLGGFAAGIVGARAVAGTDPLLAVAGPELAMKGLLFSAFVGGLYAYRRTPVEIEMQGGSDPSEN